MDIRDLTYNYYIKYKEVERPPSHWENQKILELGAGAANYSVFFKPEDYTAVDLDPNVASYVPNFIQADINDLPFKDNAFDQFIAISLLEHLRHPQDVLLRLSKICRHGGLVLVPVLDSFPFLYDPINWTRKKLGKSIVNFGMGGYGHISMYYCKDWDAMFRNAGFIVKECKPGKIDIFQALEFFLCSIFISRFEYVDLMNKMQSAQPKKASNLINRFLLVMRKILYPFYGILRHLKLELKGPIMYTFIIEKDKD